nr:immunoglobulin light chain junction region [Macaca mulatta]MOX90404.1 immunoglobulin light chain junction region [Macaca mulatta]
CQHSFGTPFSF